MPRTCRYCRSGRTNHCVRCQLHTAIGIQRNGGWAQYCVVPAFCAVAVPQPLAVAQCVIVEPMSCIVNGWDRMEMPAPDANVLIVGAGIIGLLWLSLFHHRGHRRLTISEKADGRRAIASGGNAVGQRLILMSSFSRCCASDQSVHALLILFCRLPTPKDSALLGLPWCVQERHWPLAPTPRATI